MRAPSFAALSLVLAGCVSFTTAGTEESVSFSGGQAPAEKAQAVLKPYGDLPLAMSFSCPKKTEAISTSYVIPLPPVIPVGFTNEKVAYLRVRMPAGTETAVARARIVTSDGTTMPLSDARQAKRTIGPDGAVETTYAVNQECEALDGGTLQIAALSFENKNYPASEARLRFDSQVTGSVGWWPPGLFNGGRAVSKGSDALATSGH